MPPQDTTARALRAQFQMLRHTSGASRVATAVQLTTLAREFALSGIRARHPHWSRQRIEFEFCAQLFGRDVATKVRAATQLRGGLAEPER